MNIQDALYERDGCLYFINEGGSVFPVPKPKFKLGELVFDKSQLVVLSQIVYTLERGWVCEKRYCSIDNGEIVERGGLSCWWDEKDFEPITQDSDVAVLQQVAVFYSQRKIKELEKELKKHQQIISTIKASQEILKIFEICSRREN